LIGGAKITLEGLLPFALTGVLFGLLYNTLFYPRTLVEYTEAGTIGLLLGLAAGISEQTVLKRWLRHLSFSQAAVARTFYYAVAVVIALSLVLSIEPTAEGECRYFGCVAGYVRGPLFIRDLAFSMVFAFLAVVSAQVIFVVGTRNFGRLLAGRYRTPRELRATFMFADIRGSTRIAEALGHERFSALLRDFFTDVSAAIHRSKGEVYQYVGDEVVVVWPGDAKSGRWLECFRAMQEVIRENRVRYEERYGAAPEFKAGVHVGDVILTEVGSLQRAHVYHGDVLNTAARIQGECNASGFDLLVSEDSLKSSPDINEADFQPIGERPLRGKSHSVKLFGLKSARTTSGSA